MIKDEGGGRRGWEEGVGGGWEEGWEEGGGKDNNMATQHTYWRKIFIEPALNVGHGLGG